MLSRFDRALPFILFVAGWFALIAQFYLIIANRVASIGETIIRYFSFFTILTNILVAICCTTILFQRSGKAAKFFLRSDTLTAIAVYITIVGLVYNIILRFLWNPKGLQLVVDELLHSVIPALFVIFWFLSIGKQKQKLNWNSLPRWLIYPAAYLGFVLVRGAYSGFYPYPFINVGQLSYSKVLVNCAALLLFFSVISMLFIGVARRRQRSMSGR